MSIFRKIVLWLRLASCRWRCFVITLVAVLMFWCGVARAWDLAFRAGLGLFSAAPPANVYLTDGTQLTGVQQQLAWRVGLMLMMPYRQFDFALSIDYLPAPESRWLYFQNNYIARSLNGIEVMLKGYRRYGRWRLGVETGVDILQVHYQLHGFMKGPPWVWLNIPSGWSAAPVLGVIAGYQLDSHWQLALNVQYRFGRYFAAVHEVSSGSSLMDLKAWGGLSREGCVWLQLMYLL